MKKKTKTKNSKGDGRTVQMNMRVRPTELETIRAIAETTYTTFPELIRAMVRISAPVIMKTFNEETKVNQAVLRQHRETKRK